jgi:hypothetical protein
MGAGAIAIAGIMTTASLWAGVCLGVVAGVVWLCTMFGSHHVTMMCFLLHLFAFTAVRRVVFPFLISPYRFYAGNMYRNATGFRPPSVFREMVCCYLLLFPANYAIATLLFRLHGANGCGRPAAGLAIDRRLVFRMSLTSWLLTIVLDNIPQVKAITAMATQSFKYAEDLAVGVAVAPAMSFVFWWKYQPALLAALHC